jgi:hypothetical protein
MAQMAMAASIWSMAGPVVPTGKNRVGSESRQAASSRQSVVMVVSKTLPYFVMFFTSVHTVKHWERWIFRSER